MSVGAIVTDGAAAWRDPRRAAGVVVGVTPTPW